MLLQLQLSGKYVDTKCMVAARKYKCAVAFPECSASHVTGDRPPCAEICTSMCTECKIVPCPCYHLQRKSSGCMGVESFDNWLWGEHTLDESLHSGTSRKAMIPLSLKLAAGVVAALVTIW